MNIVRLTTNQKNTLMGFLTADSSWKPKWLGIAPIEMQDGRWVLPVNVFTRNELSKIKDILEDKGINYLSYVVDTSTLNAAKQVKLSALDILQLNSR